MSLAVKASSLFLTNWNHNIVVTCIFRKSMNCVQGNLTKLHCHLLFLSSWGMELVFWSKLAWLTFYKFGWKYRFDWSISLLHLTNAFIFYSIDYPMCIHIWNFLLRESCWRALNHWTPILYQVLCLEFRDL